MRVPALLFMVTAAVIFFQLVAGSLFVFGFISSGVHITTGIITGVFSLATMVAALVSKPRYLAFRLTSVVLFLLILLQAGLGFAAFRSDALVVAHFTIALIIYGAAVAGTFYAARWNRMPAAAAGPTSTS